jgi:RNA polymerase sigma-70 factor (ECF subfamily)
MSTVDKDSALVRRAMAGDREAFSDLAAANWRRLLALVRSIVADLDAEDVVQDGMIKAWRKLGSLRDPRAFSAWLTRIVANTAIARARRRRIFDPIDGAAVAAAEEAMDVQIDVGRLLARLAPKQRAVLHLTTIEGFTDSEIGDALGISSSSVRVHRLNNLGWVKEDDKLRVGPLDEMSRRENVRTDTTINLLHETWGSATIASRGDAENPTVVLLVESVLADARRTG